MAKPRFLDPLIGKGAGQCELVHAESGSVLATHVEPAFDSKARRRGLLGRDAVSEDYALIIAPCGSVHTFFMRFPIDVVFVARDGTVVKTCRAVKPWRIAGALRAFAAIEAAPGFIDQADLLPGEVVGLREIQHRRRATDTPAPPAGATTPGAGVLKARHSDASRRITLAELVARRTPLAWFESVAIVQEVIAKVLARGPADGPRVPELKHLALTPDGGVELLADGPAEYSPVHRAGLVLLALTPEAQLPLQLRLLTLEEVSPTPRFRSLKELHTELEFFERPDRRDIIRAVYARDQQGTTPATAVPPPLLEPSPPRRHSRWWKNRAVWIVAGVVLAAVLAAAVAREWQRPEGAWMRSGVSQAVQAAQGGARKATESAREALTAARQRAGLVRSEPQAPPPVDPGPGHVRRPSDVPLPSLPVTSQQTTALPAPGPPTDLPRPPEPEIAAAAGQTPTAVDAAAPAPSKTADLVYSAADPLVVPPELVRPNLSMNPPAGVRAADLPEFEVVISATGEVESVRLRSSGLSPRQTMMLSAVKDWRFRPATRNGQPVRYRLQMRLPRQ